MQVDANLVAYAFEPLIGLNTQLIMLGSQTRFKQCKMAVAMLTSDRHVQLNLCHMECSCQVEGTGFSTVYDGKPIKGVACWEMSTGLDKGSIAMTAGFKFDTEPFLSMLSSAGKDAFYMLHVACTNRNLVLPDGGVVYKTDYDNTHCAGCMQSFGIIPMHCTRCMSGMLYCSEACQRAHYKEHKDWCKPGKMMLMRFWVSQCVSCVWSLCGHTDVD